MLAMLPVRDMDRWQIPSSCAPIAAELRDVRRDDGEVAEPGDAAGDERKSEGEVEAGAGGGDPSMATGLVAGLDVSRTRRIVSALRPYVRVNEEARRRASP